MMQEHFWNNRIYYRTNEWQPGRTTLIFIHGVSGSSSAWWPYEKIFEGGYNILNYDIRGHGRSKKYPNYEDYRISNFVQDLEDLVNHLGVKQAVLISNSFGGLIHLEYLKSHGDSVPANVFTSPEVYLYDLPAAKILRPALALLGSILRFLPASLTPRGHVDYGKYIGSTDWHLGRNWADMRNTGFRAHFFTLRQSMRRGQEYGLAKITAPTLVIHGGEDTMVPIRNAARLAEGVKGAEFMEISGVDHNTVHNAVRKMSELIESFLARSKGRNTWL